MISVYEQRRRAPLHFALRAENALKSASVLSNADVREGFIREASIALELIVKAVIAQRLEVGESLGVTKVPATHNVPQLWSRQPAEGQIKITWVNLP
jgi:hypothetical protein